MEKEYINIGKLDINKYQKLCDEKIITDKVIITLKQIEHINEQRLGIYDKYKSKLHNIIKNPDYIIKDTKHKDTGLIVKKYDNNLIVVLKLNTSEKDRKNSIITIWEIKEKRLERYLLTHETIYRKE